MRKVLTVLALALLAGRAQAQATATICKDASTSAASGRGACSGHGGVDAKATRKAMEAVTKAEKKADKKVERANDKMEKSTAKAERAETKTPDAMAPNAAMNKPAKAASRKGEDDNAVGAIAKCKDGKYSHASNRRGACSRHGGVASWM